MREYEVVYIFRSDLPVEDLESRLEKYHERLTGSGGGEITAVEHWGKRQLAYPIQNQLNGYYVVAQFRCDAAVLPEYERLLKLEDQLLRYLVVLSEGELPTPPSASTEKEASTERGGRGDGGGKPAAATRAKEAAEKESDESSPATEDSESDAEVEVAEEETV